MACGLVTNEFNRSPITNQHPCVGIIDEGE
ncbi:Protein of unknown function [Pyronema omphalodes CBS 100304]|uniref:Uncharacterized protein n=1 Tax=Pyronema omphalodes (strain CBS 100304) TaxID=1076935 RepID=U4LTK3_PYROM|nr:Protein of unknown function [Pyronema omphalodes CBS 100304]